MSLPDYQIFIDVFSSCFIIAFPIALTILLTQKLADVFLDFVFGTKIKF